MSNKIVFITIFYSILANGQNLHDAISKIESKKYIESKYVKQNYSFSIFASDEYVLLKKTATNEELINLTSNTNGSVKSLAFLILAREKYSGLFDIILKQLADTTRVRKKHGCVIIGEYTTDYFISIISKGTFPDLDIPKMSEVQKSKLDSLLILDKNSKLQERQYAISSIKSTPENYILIKSIVQKEKNPAALSNLAAYKNPLDKKLIASFFKREETQCEALNATVIYKDEYFYPFIIKIFHKLWEKSTIGEYDWQTCYAALVNYPREKTFKLLEKVTLLSDIRSYKYRVLGKELLIAITKYPNPMFENLKNRIRLDEEDIEEVNYRLRESY